ncbi:MAG: hypothetical protein ACYDCL_02115 [Myxococcales bacterium]
MTTIRKSAAFALALSGLSACHGKSTALPQVPKIPERPALATLLFTGDGWGEFAPCG